MEVNRNKTRQQEEQKCVESGNIDAGTGQVNSNPRIPALLYLSQALTQPTNKAAISQKPPSPFIINQTAEIIK